MSSSLEFGGGYAGAERGDGDPGTAELFRKRFREREHIGFGCVVHRHERAGLESGGGGDVQYLSTPPSDHVWQKQTREMSQRGDVHLYHLELIVGFGLLKWTEIAEPGVIDQRADVETAQPNLCSSLFGGAGLAEILNDNLYAHLVLRA